jgi:hypothetical protein
MRSELSPEISDQRLKATFFRSITLVTSAAAITLAGSEGQLFPSALTPVIAVLGWILVDHLQLIQLPVFLGNLFGIGALIATGIEFTGGTLERKLLAGAHLLVYLTWIVLLLPKRHRQYWWLIALSVLQVAVAGLLSSGIAFGGAMMGMLLLLLWTLSVFSLFRVLNQYRNRQRHEPESGPAVASGISASTPESTQSTSATAVQGSARFWQTFFGLHTAHVSETAHPERSSGQILVRHGLQRDPSETWVGPRFRGMVAGSYIISLVLALFVFAAFPRVWVPGSSLFGDTSDTSGLGGQRTGFSDTVELGDIGMLMDNHARVLSFSIQDIRKKTQVTADEFAAAMQMDEVRFRGNVFACYQDGQWMRGFDERGFPLEGLHRPGDLILAESDFRLEIVQDPSSVAFAFAPYPVTREVPSASNQTIRQLSLSQSLVFSRRRQRNIARSFVVECCRPERVLKNHLPGQPPQSFEDDRLLKPESFYLMNGNFLPRNISMFIRQIPEPVSYAPEFDIKNVLPRLYAEANRICTEDNRLVSPEERINRIMAHLSPDNGFRYSRRSERKDRSLDPVEDFLLNTKTGHCEYFASACTLMLQAVAVPARLVNGYYGSEINALTGKFEVRQRHAHAWVEAWVNDSWLTLESTPSSERQSSVSGNASGSLISNLQTALSDLWNDGIQRMSAERQREFFAPVISTSKSLLQTIREQGLLNTARIRITQFLRSPQEWISWQGGLATFVILLCLVSVIHLVSGKRLQDWWMLLRDLLSRRRRTARSVIRFYEGFCSLCERHGMKIPASNSAFENARMAGQKFGRQLESASLKNLPEQIAAAFNGVRFGQVTLSHEQTLQIGRDLHAFAIALRDRTSTAPKGA